MAHAIESSLATPNTTAVFLVDLASAPLISQVLPGTPRL